MFIQFQKDKIFFIKAVTGLVKLNPHYEIAMSFLCDFIVHSLQGDFKF